MIAGYYQANERVKDARCVGATFPPARSLALRFVLCQGQSRAENLRAALPCQLYAPCLHGAGVTAAVRAIASVCWCCEYLLNPNNSPYLFGRS